MVKPTTIEKLIQRDCRLNNSINIFPKNELKILAPEGTHFGQGSIKEKYPF